MLAGHLEPLLEEYHHTVMEELRFTLSRQTTDIRLMTPAFGSESIVIGAAELAFEPVLNNPHSLLGGDLTIRAQ